MKKRFPFQKPRIPFRSSIYQIRFSDESKIRRRNKADRPPVPHRYPMPAQNQRKNAEILGFLTLEPVKIPSDRQPLTV